MPEYSRGDDSGTQDVSGRKMVWSSTPKALWDERLKVEAKKWSSPVHNVFELDGETPRTHIGVRWQTYHRFVIMCGMAGCIFRMLMSHTQMTSWFCDAGLARAQTFG